MATAANIIKDALQDLSVLRAGKDPSTNDYTDCLRRLNKLLELWSTQTLLVPYRTQISHALDGSESYTIGSGGDINTTRPSAIRSAFVTHQGDDSPVTVLRDRAAYDRIHHKDTTGFPRVVYYEPEIPLGRLFVWYTGDASYTLKLSAQGQLTEWPDKDTDVTLPPGYEQWIGKELAIEIAPMYETAASAEVIEGARQGKAMVRRANLTDPIMRYDCAIPGGSGKYDIEGDR